MFNHKLPTDFPMQTLRKKTSPCKYKNEPGRFLGEGVSFRAKLIGVLEVPEARGDRMCQEALADLKMAIRAAGEHKQRIQVHVAIDGLRLRDDKTGDSLYHHPVHKISFIAQDMTDSRAFGYIFGSPDTGHRFFGIKTDKAASQVVIAMRDLFQVVFELKKKEVEIAKQQLSEAKVLSSGIIRQSASGLAGVEPKPKNDRTMTLGESSSASKNTDLAEGGVAELVDLEQELSSLRRGLTQVEGLTPSTDPFGDSFIGPSSQKGLLPPPPSGSAGRGRSAPPARVFSPHKATLPFDLPSAPDFEPPPSLVNNLEPELKNPPKKVLKDLVPTTLLSDIMPEKKDGYGNAKDYGGSTTMTSMSRHSGGTVSIAKPPSGGYGGNYFPSDPFAETDPFDNTDPFDSFKEDPFTSMAEFPKSIMRDDLKSKLSSLTIDKEKDLSLDNGKNVFNGPLQVTLPPEPVPKSPRLKRQNTDSSSSSIRQRPQPSSKLNSESSPPPPLPPKKVTDIGTVRAPPRPPHDHELDVEDSDTGPPLPRPMRKKEPLADRSIKPRLSSAATNSSEDEYLTPAPPPLPSARRFDITLSQLLVCTMPELAARLRVPEATLSSMTLPQLTDYLRSYLATDKERAHIHVEPKRHETEKPPITTTAPSINKRVPTPPVAEFKPQFEDNFAPADTNDTFVANFEDFDVKANSNYDRYAAFREIQEQELNSKSILDPVGTPKEETKQDSDEKEELAAIHELIVNKERDFESKETSRSPLKTLDELTLDSFNMFRNSVSPRPTQIDTKIEDVKSIMKNLHIESSRRSISPREQYADSKMDDMSYGSDRYAALREITITEPTDDFESLPSEALPKERKKSDEKSDGFDNSDFFDCIDNSSLSFSHVEDAFRKSPVVREKEEVKVEVKKEIVAAPAPAPARERKVEPPARLSTGSISDVVSGSSPDTKGACVGGRGSSVGGRWAPLAGASCGSSDSRSSPRPRRRRQPPHARDVPSSSSSRDGSPWDEEPPVSRLQRPPSHRESSRHGSSGSRECLDSGSGREKDKRDKHMRDRDISRDRDGSGRGSRDSGSGRDRRDSKERDLRDHRERRDRRSRDRETDWDRDRPYRERDYRDSHSRERNEYSRHRKPRIPYDDEEDYSDGCGSGSSPRERWPDQRWRRDDRNYGSLGWRESRRRNEVRQPEDPDRRYGTTLNWPSRRQHRTHELRDPRDVRVDVVRDPREVVRDVREGREVVREGRDVIRDVRDGRESLRQGRELVREGREGRGARGDPRRRSKREDHRSKSRDYRFSSDFSPRDREHASPFDNDFQDTPTSSVKPKRGPYSSFEGTRFSFDPEDATSSPLSASSARNRDGDGTARFRFDSDSVSPRSMFEDDFTMSTPRGRTASIAEEEESEVPPLRQQQLQQTPKDIKKSESVNIFTRESDPFENDAFFACTGSDRVARRDNWPGDFHGFENT